ncbi:MAG: hypothetical protein R3Y24_01215 [Eubacteriales bacterium]
MKPRELDKSIRTTPKGVYEGGVITEEKKQKTATMEEMIRDAQDNGYVVPKRKKSK